MKWRTEIKPLECRGLIDLDTSVVTIGSCFADETGGRLREHGFNVSVNPMGIMFNPTSIAMAVSRAVEGRLFTAGDVTPTPEGNRYVSFHRHSSFSASGRDALVDILNANLCATRQRLIEADCLFITLGSSRCFVHKEKDMVVANCHRFHPDTFAIRDLTERDTVELLVPVLRNLKALNPKLKTVMTVSPVRHVAYGLTADSLSKARLIVAAHAIAGEIEDTLYFPAYEAVVDDLRDYRFYAYDLVHPSEAAVDYIFDLFSESFLSTELQARLPAWRRLWRKACDGHIADADARVAAAALKASNSTINRLVQCITSAK